jgi:homoserine kinase
VSPAGGLAAAAVAAAVAGLEAGVVAAVSKHARTTMREFSTNTDNIKPGGTGGDKNCRKELATSAWMAFNEKEKKQTNARWPG